MDIFELFKKIEKKNETNKPITHIIVGLGNKGDKYENTRHNAGFMSLDYASGKWGADITTAKFDALIGEVTIGETRALLMKPQTFMNNSGIAVSKAAKFYKIEPRNIIVVYDDISLEPGKMRIRKKGSAGGHNGIKSIIEHLGTDEFPRVKMGVGKKPHPEMDLADWVLSKFTPDEKKALSSRFDDAEKSMIMITNGEIEKAMNNFNN